MRAPVLVLCVALALSGCAGGSVQLSDIARAACAAQAAANTAEDIARARGNEAWAARFSRASTITGIGCAW